MSAVVELRGWDGRSSGAAMRAVARTDVNLFIAVCVLL